MTRIWTPSPLFSGAVIPLDAPQVHHVQTVLRRRIGQHVLMFNEQYGEWNGVINVFEKKSGMIEITTQNRPAPKKMPQIHLLFAPLKQGPLSFLIEKSVELGVGSFMPQKTDHTVIGTINGDRARIHIQEAAEQCGRLTVPSIAPLESLKTTLLNWDPHAPLFVCDERRSGTPILQALSGVCTTQDLFFLNGPEGGFSKAEFALMAQKPFVHFITLGPHILRAETAALAAIAIGISARETLSQRTQL